MEVDKKEHYLSLPWMDASELGVALDVVSDTARLYIRKLNEKNLIDVYYGRLRNAKRKRKYVLLEQVKTQLKKTRNIVFDKPHDPTLPWIDISDLATALSLTKAKALFYMKTLRESHSIDVYRMRSVKTNYLQNHFLLEQVRPALDKHRQDEWGVAYDLSLPWISIDTLAAKLSIGSVTARKYVKKLHMAKKIDVLFARLKGERKPKRHVLLNQIEKPIQKLYFKEEKREIKKTIVLKHELVAALKRANKEIEQLKEANQKLTIENKVINRLLDRFGE